jgi:hypothetical protein
MSERQETLRRLIRANRERLQRGTSAAEAERLLRLIAELEEELGRLARPNLHSR